MKRFALRTLQGFGAGAMLRLAALIAAGSRGDLTLEIYVIALIGVSLIGVVSGQPASPARTAARAAQGSGEEVARQAQDHLVDAALRQIIRLIEDYVIVNSSYREDLSGSNSKLLQLLSRNDVQDIIDELISANLAMQQKVLSGASLDEAFGAVEKIRRDLESKRWVVGAKEERLGAVTVSFGIARLAFDEGAESFVQRADAKLFEAKAAGRNQVAVDRPGQNPSKAQNSSKANVSAD